MAINRFDLEGKGRFCVIGMGDSSIVITSLDYA